jgi:hypothetical protein
MKEVCLFDLIFRRLITEAGSSSNEPLFVSSSNTQDDSLDSNHSSICFSFAAKSSWGRLRSCAPFDDDSSDVLKPVNPDDVSGLAVGEPGGLGASANGALDVGGAGVQPVSFRGPRITRAPDEEEEEERRRGPPPLLRLLCLWEVSNYNNEGWMKISEFGCKSEPS